MGTIIIPTVVSLSILGLVLAVVLYLVAQKFKVEEDPRIDEVEAVMPVYEEVDTHVDISNTNEIVIEDVDLNHMLSLNL